KRTRTLATTPCVATAPCTADRGLPARLPPGIPHRRSGTRRRQRERADLRRICPRSRAGNADPLPLATGESVQVAPHSLGRQADPVQPRLDAITQLSLEQRVIGGVFGVVPTLARLTL